SSTKTKSSRSRPVSPQRKRNRGGVGRRVLNENEIAEESAGESSTKTKSSRSHPASPQRKRNRGGVVRRVLNENEIVEESSDESSTSMECGHEASVLMLMSTQSDLQPKIFFHAPNTLRSEEHTSEL